MTDQIERNELPDPVASTRVDRIKGEIVSGGAVHEIPDDELAGGVQGALSMLVIVGLFVLLAVINIWWFVFAVGIVISIFLHELGHFVTARWTGMKVTQFFLFFGPRLWSFRRGETEYGVRALPLGAFVRIIGMHEMDPGVPAEDEHRTYRQQSFPRRLLVISGGSIMHMLIAIVLLFAVYLGQGERTIGEELFVGAAIEGLPAEQAGIQDGDQIISVGGVLATDPAQLGELIRSYEPADVVDFVVVRDGVEQTISVGLGARIDVPEDDELFGTAYLGVSSFNPTEFIDHSVVGAAGNSVVDLGPTAWQSARGVFTALNPVNVIEHVTGQTDDIATRPTTLVGVTGLADDVAESSGAWGVIELLAVLNVFVGVFNMFPLLPLDGGHAAVAVYERVREAMRGGRERYFADVERLMPLALGVVAVLLMFMSAGLWLDITNPI